MKLKLKTIADVLVATAFVFFFVAYLGSGPENYTADPTLLERWETTSVKNYLAGLAILGLAGVFYLIDWWRRVAVEKRRQEDELLVTETRIECDTKWQEHEERMDRNRANIIARNGG